MESCDALFVYKAGHVSKYAKVRLLVVTVLYYKRADALECPPFICSKEKSLNRPSVIC